MARNRKQRPPDGTPRSVDETIHSNVNRRFYSAEFKRQLVELVRGGRTPEDLAKDYEPHAQTIRSWVTQADIDEGRSSNGGLTTDEREELNRLRRENRRLQEEKDILKKAAVYSTGHRNTTTSDPWLKDVVNAGSQTRLGRDREI